jgi:hypothetical protein
LIGYSDRELLDAAKHLGRENVLAILGNQPPTSDPDILDVYGAGAHGSIEDTPAQHYIQLGTFLLAHAKDLLIASDTGALLDLETAERNSKNLQRPTYREWWRIAEARLNPKDADAILDAAETRWPQVADIQLARWQIQGQSALPEILEHFYQSPETQDALACAIRDDSYEPLIEAILASDGHLQISSHPMECFESFAKYWNANFDQQIIDWVFAQPPDPDISYLGPSRKAVVESSGVSRKLILDPRFDKADGQLLYVVERNQVGDLKLNHAQAVRLDQLIKQIYSQLPQSSPEPVLEETRTLLLEGVHVN